MQILRVDRASSFPVPRFSGIMLPERFLLQEYARRATGH